VDKLGLLLHKLRLFPYPSNLFSHHAKLIHKLIHPVTAHQSLIGE
jgi:hypothetical protein